MLYSDLGLYFSKNFQIMSRFLETIGSHNKINIAGHNKQQYYCGHWELSLIKTQWFDKNVDIVKKHFEKYKPRLLYMKLQRENNGSYMENTKTYHISLNIQL